MLFFFSIDRLLIYNIIVNYIRGSWLEKKIKLSYYLVENENFILRYMKFNNMLIY